VVPHKKFSINFSLFDHFFNPKIDVLHSLNHDFHIVITAQTHDFTLHLMAYSGVESGFYARISHQMKCKVVFLKSYDYVKIVIKAV